MRGVVADENQPGKNIKQYGIQSDDKRLAELTKMEKKLNIKL